MKIVIPDPFSLIYSVPPALPGSETPGPMLCLGLLAGFRLGPCAASPLQALVPEEELWQAVDAAIPEGDVLDPGLPKPCSEYLVYGAACSEKPVSTLECAVQVGEKTKKLFVSGPRLLRPGDAVEPELFTRMDISWANAFGGQGHAFNPYGKGFNLMADGTRHWPNVQSVDARTLEDMEQEPAGFAALPVTWPQRSSLLGAMDSSWLKTNWPGLPPDTDPAYACVAPRDQRFPGFFQGGEPILLYNMHPREQQMRSAIPGLRGRIFIQRTAAADGFIELACDMETLWLFPEQELGVLLFRAVASVLDEECEDVAAVMALAEDVRMQPLPAQEYYSMCLPELQSMNVLLSDVPSAVDAPPPSSGQAGLATAAAGAALGGAPPEAYCASSMSELVQEMELQLQQRFKQIGLDREQVSQWLAQNDKHIAPDSDEYSGAAMDDNSLEPLEQVVAEMQEHVQQSMERLGLNREELECWLEEKLTVEDSKYDKWLEELRLLAASELLPPEQRAEIANAASGLAAAAASVEELGRKVREQQSGAVGPPVPQETLQTEQALARLCETGSLAQCDLTNCDFSGKDLNGADLRGCLMSGVVWNEVILSGADLRDVVAVSASLKGARLDTARLNRADFENASLAGATARGCIADKTRFLHANLEGVDMADANACDAEMRGARLFRAQCHGLQARGLRLQEADMEMSVFLGADLTGARANEKTNASGADFRHAICEDICWSGVRLAEARFDEADLDRADLSRADLSKTSLVLASARNARLEKAKLCQADLTGCNLFMASLRRTDMSGAVIRNANLFGADLYHCRIDAHTLKDVNLDRTLLDPLHSEATGG